jgi:glycosyltransferase involved in cell wall biosynthesis
MSEKSKVMRLAIVSLRSFEEPTGNIESILNVIRGLGELGCEVDLLVPSITEYLEKVAATKIIGYSSATFLKFNVLGAQEALIISARSFKLRYDIIQLQLPSPAFSGFAQRLRRVAEIPVIACFDSACHRAPAVAMPKGFKLKMNIWLRRFLNSQFRARIGGSNYDAAVVSSYFQADELRHMKWAAPVHVIPNSTVVERFNLPRSTSNSVNSCTGKKTICYIGHLNFIKGVEFLISAFKFLACERDDIHLVLACSGRGNVACCVEEALKDVDPSLVTLEAGEINVADFLRSCGVLVLPYVAPFGHQFFPNLVIEALASSTPLVVSTVEPMPEIIKDGVTGFLAEPGSVEGLVIAIQRALALNQSERETLGRKQKNLAAARFDYTVVTKDYLNLYNKILHG